MDPGGRAGGGLAGRVSPHRARSIRCGLVASAVAELYFDLGSPYAYLAVERAESVLGQRPALMPVLVGAIFGWRGQGSWAHTDGRAAGMAEIERRAHMYGLPPMVWPPEWPANALAAMRCAIWADRQRRLAPFALAVGRRQWTEGADIAEPEVLSAAATEAGLDAPAMLEAIGRPELKEQLRAATERAWEAGVQGVPTLRIGTQLFFGDDRLGDAAAALSSPGLPRTCSVRDRGGPGHEKTIS
jgi:2-hydroxychromene-2-carboxylate isomerase